MKKSNYIIGKKKIGFEVDMILYQRLADAAWRRRITLSRLLREYSKDGLFREIVEAGERLKA
jgi:hypothetical protein